MDKLKRCSKCKNEFTASAEFFYKKKDTVDGLRHWCKKCDLEANQKWKENNPEKNKEIQREYYRKHKEYKSVYYKKWCAGNLDRLRKYIKQWTKENAEYVKIKSAERGKAWKKANPERAKIRSHSYKSRKLAAPGTFTAEDIQKHYQSQNGNCWWCGKPVGENYHIEHRIPLSRGGTNAADNICISCPECNWSKSDKMPWEWNGRLL